ncbi:hypothetical protein [Pseudomonas graminis]
MMNVDKMKDITEFYQELLMVIHAAIGSSLSRQEEEKKAMINRWLAKAGRARHCRAHRKNEIISMFDEVETHSLKTLERRVRTLHENCTYILEEFR